MDGNAISKFAKENFSEEFRKIAPMNQHIKILSELGSEISGEKITLVEIEVNRTSIIFGGGKVELGIRIADGKIAGVGF